MPSERVEHQDVVAWQRDVGQFTLPTDPPVGSRPSVAVVRQPREKRSVTLDADVAQAVDQLVDEGAAESFSAAINDAAARWVANQQLAHALDELYESDPDARPSAEAVKAAAANLGLA